MPNEDHGMSRRIFMRNTGLMAAGGAALSAAGEVRPLPAPSGPGKSYRPKIAAAFVRRQGDYGMRWPGQVYDGEAARAHYIEWLRETAAAKNLDLSLRETPLYSDDEGAAWIAQAEQNAADGLFLLLLDRQDHAWTVARRAADSPVPAVIYSPLGTSFTTNTKDFAGMSGCVVYSTDRIEQAEYGLSMLAAGPRIAKTVCVVIKDGKETEETLLGTGITLRYVPGNVYLDAFDATPVDDDVNAIADAYLSGAHSVIKATRDDVIAGARGYRACCRILEEQHADAISMDCLGILGKLKQSLPCLAWSHMNDDGIPAACEADINAIQGHIMVQYLFGRPGFQQDPVPETWSGGLIGSHCSCPTRLRGFHSTPEPYDIMPHHGLRDATARTLWPEGERATCLHINKGTKEAPPEFLISAGTVRGNPSVPPSGGCVVAVEIKFDGAQDPLSFPGFHQLFFLGDFAKPLRDFCQLRGFTATMV